MKQTSNQLLDRITDTTNGQDKQTDRQTDTMGKTGIRTVCKVDFDKPAAEQPNLHVSFPCWVRLELEEEEC